MTTAWASIIVALISGPIMWLLWRLDKRNTKQHGLAVDLIQEIRKDIKTIKLVQSITNRSVHKQGEALEKHLEDHTKDATFTDVL